MAKPTPGLRKRGGIWHIEKTICGVRIFESCHSSDLAEAERFLAEVTRRVRSTILYGEREPHTVDEACERYVKENKDARGIERQIIALSHIVKCFGNMQLSAVRAEIFDDYIKSRDVSPSTIKREIGAFRAVLSDAATAWRDTSGHYWLEKVPTLPIMKLDPRKPRPITQAEQVRLFRGLPAYLANMATFAVHTGCRDQEVCGLRWEWEFTVSGSDRIVFVIPGSVTKNGYDKMVPLNATAASSVNTQRGRSSEWVFTLDGNRISRMNNRAWKSARAKASLDDVRVHDLRHTFARRLRSADVSQEDIADLLGHRHGTVTQHYSKATIDRLMSCVDRLINDDGGAEMVLLRKVG